MQRLHTPSFIDNKLWVYYCAPVVCPFSKCEVQDHEKRDDGDDTTGGCSDARIFNSLCKGIKPRETGLGRHLGCELRHSSEESGRYRSAQEFQRGSNGGRHERECDETDPGLRSGRKSLERCHKRQKSIGLDDHGAEQLKPASQVRWG